MYGKKHVNKPDHHRPHRISSKGKDKRIFSRTAVQTEGINTLSAASPMRGGIRL